MVKQELQHQILQLTEIIRDDEFGVAVAHHDS